MVEETALVLLPIRGTKKALPLCMYHITILRGRWQEEFIPSLLSPLLLCSW